ncbi:MULTISPECIES: rhodanese-like domain-containing protein [Streptomyces]|uniref:Rhodanese-like domain-containing protein n=1 Tax=Streptomyces mordarskii TaxID=1226758 RepID=A0ABN1E1Y0_9ACTN|nr:rhodanese-like domain-containing protein [Streptomyces sp. AgN23]AJZ82393.1 rhodanese-like domain-containing protein [Streptomyces sp. AgN23]
MFPFLRRGPGRLTPQQARQQTRDGKVVPLDVRETPEWRAGHASDALHLPLSRLMAGASLPAAVRDKPVVTICRSGRRSQQAVKVPAGRGVEATDVAGGMTAWTRAGLPVTSEGGSGGGIA